MGDLRVRRFQFRLARVLRYQQQRQRQAEIELRKKAQALQLAQTQRTKIATELQQAIAGLAAVPVPEFQMTLRLNGVRHSSQVEQRLHQAQTDIQQAQQELQAASQHWLQLKRKVAVLDVLFEQQRQEHRKRVQRQDEAELSEMVVQRWSRAQPAAEGERAGQGSRL